jgi:hypothetical protein
LIGEAVLLINDLCSSLSNKRVIQLHQYGKNKTGLLTAEVNWFLFNSNEENIAARKFLPNVPVVLI